MEFGGWFKDNRYQWEKELDKLSHRDFEKLGIEKDKLHDIMETLYDWRVFER